MVGKRTLSSKSHCDNLLNNRKNQIRNGSISQRLKSAGDTFWVRGGCNKFYPDLDLEWKRLGQENTSDIIDIDNGIGVQQELLTIGFIIVGVVVAANLLKN
jgi:hypothetical protein